MESKNHTHTLRLPHHGKALIHAIFTAFSIVLTQLFKNRHHSLPAFGWQFPSIGRGHMDKRHKNAHQGRSNRRSTSGYSSTTALHITASCFLSDLCNVSSNRFSVWWVLTALALEWLLGIRIHSSGSRLWSSEQILLYST